MYKLICRTIDKICHYQIVFFIHKNEKDNKENDLETMKLRNEKYMRSLDVVVIEKQKVKVDYISTGNWDFVMNGFLEL